MGIETNLDVNPYFDDYDPSKNYYKFLFRPSVAVQARELTQLQDILQNQIESFGDNIFVQGTIIKGCNFSFDDAYHYVKLPDLLNNGQPVNVGQFIGNYIIDNTTGLVALVVNGTSGFQSQVPNLNTLYVKYLNTGVYSGNGVSKGEFANSDILTVSTSSVSTDANSYINTLAVTVDFGTYGSVNTNPIGLGYNFSVGPGIIYQKGTFINVPDGLSAIIDPYSNQPNNVVVGFVTEENIITEYEDTSLYDGAAGYTNFNAPGAHRLQLLPTLITMNADVAATANNFLPIVEWENGQVVRSNQLTVYNKIEADMALRTYEQSGNYVVKPFSFNNVDIPGNTGYLALSAGAGVAYVNGLRTELQNQIYIPLRKGTDYVTSYGQFISTDYGNYALVDQYIGEFNASIGSTIYLQDTYANIISSAVNSTSFANTTAPGNTIGTARIYAVEFEPTSPYVVGDAKAQYRFYVTDIKMNTGKNFANVRSFYANTDTGSGPVYGFADAYIPANTTYSLNDTTFNTLLFDFGKPAVKMLASNSSYTFRTLSSGSFPAYGSGNAALSITLSGNTGFTYGANPNGLDGDQEKEFLIIAKGTANVVNVNVNSVLTTNTLNVNVIGNTSTNSTAFTTQYQVSDYIAVGTEIRQVVTVTNNSFLTVDTPFTNAWTNFAHNKVYPNNVPIPISNRNSNIVVANNTSLSINLKGASGVSEQLSSILPIDLYYNIQLTNAPHLNKTIQKGMYTVINTGTNVAGVNGPWCLGFPDVMALDKVYRHIGAASTATADDVTNEFILNTGQKDTLYDLSSISIRPGSQLVLKANNLLGTFTGTLTNANNWITSLSIDPTTIGVATGGSISGPATPNNWTVTSVNSTVIVMSGNFLGTTNAGATASAFAPDYLTVQYDVFTKLSLTVNTGFFTVESYPINNTDTITANTITTAQIPIYKSSTTGNNYDLRNLVDFRPYIANTVALANTSAAAANSTNINPANTSIFTSGINGLYLPATNYTYQSDISYYLGRYDKIALSSQGKFSTIEGLPAENPTIPLDVSNEMTLGVVKVPPYPTLSTTSGLLYNRPDYSISLNINETQRFTMADISNIKTSVDSLEYYTSLNLLEQSLTSLNLLSPTTGLNRFKNGIFVDDFSSLTTPNYSHPENSIQLNTVGDTAIMPPAQVIPVTLVANTPTPTLTPTEVVLCQSTLATDMIPVVTNVYQYSYKSTTYSPIMYMFPNHILWSEPRISIRGIDVDDSHVIAQALVNPDARSIVGGVPLTDSNGHPYPLNNGIRGSSQQFNPNFVNTKPAVDVGRYVTLNNTTVSVTNAIPSVYATNFIGGHTFVAAIVGMKPNTPVYFYMPAIYIDRPITLIDNVLANTANIEFVEDVYVSHGHCDVFEASSNGSAITSISTEDILNHVFPVGTTNQTLMTDDEGKIVIIGSFNRFTIQQGNIDMYLSYDNTSWQSAGAAAGGIPGFVNTSSYNNGVTFGPYIPTRGSISVSSNTVTSTGTKVIDLTQVISLDSQNFNGNSGVVISSIDLYFGNTIQNTIGGVTVKIVDKNSNIITSSYVSKSQLSANGVGSSDGSVATNIKFPLTTISSNGVYGIQVSADGNDPNVSLWGVATFANNVSLTSSTQVNYQHPHIRGIGFQQVAVSNTIDISSSSYISGDSSLKFTLYQNQYDTTTPTSVTLTNDDYEFLQVNNTIGKFIQGEKIHFTQVVNAVGTVTMTGNAYAVIGNGTTFTTTYGVSLTNDALPSWITIVGPTQTFIAQINTSSIANDTYMTVLTPAPINFTEVNHQRNKHGIVTFNIGNSEIIGIGTHFDVDFSPGHSFIIRGVSANGVLADCFEINSITNATHLVVKGAPWFTHNNAVHMESAWGIVEGYDANNYNIILNHSRANNQGSFLFQNNTVLFGQYGGFTNLQTVMDHAADRIQPVIVPYIPAKTTLQPSSSLMNPYTVTTPMSGFTFADMNSSIEFSARIASKSNEWRYDPVNGNKSIKIVCNITGDQSNVVSYSSPCITDTNKLLVYKNVITSPPITLPAPAPSLPTPPPIVVPPVPPNPPIPVANTVYNGLVDSSYVSQTITLDEGMDAENLKVYLTAYKPYGTTISVYCKLLNSYDYETFDVKDWTYMPQVSPSSAYSSTTDLYDYVELEYDLPALPAGLPFSGTVAVSNASTTVTGSLTTFAGNSTIIGTFSNGDLMIISSGNTSVLHQVNTVTSNTSLTLTEVPSITNAAATYAKAVDIQLGNGSITINSASSNVTGTNTTFTVDFSNGSFIQLMSNTNFQIVQINQITSNTSMNLFSTPTISNTAAQYAKFSFAETAFVNYENDNIVRYYNGAKAPYDTYKYYAIKITMNSNTTNIIPRVLNLRAIALSA